MRFDGRASCQGQAAGSLLELSYVLQPCLWGQFHTLSPELCPIALFLGNAVPYPPVSLLDSCSYPANLRPYLLCPSKGSCGATLAPPQPAPHMAPRSGDRSLPPGRSGLSRAIPQSLATAPSPSVGGDKVTSGGENAQGQPAPITCAGWGEESRATGEGPPKPSPAPVQTGQLLLGGQWCSVAQNTLCPHPTPAPACASLHPSPSSSQGPIKGTHHGPPSDMRAGTVPADNARVGLRQVSPRGQLRPPAHQAPPARHCSNRCSCCHGDCFAHAAGAQAGGWRGVLWVL